MWHPAIVAPSNVKTIRDLIFWEYAKLIAGSAVGNREDWPFVVRTWNKLRLGHIKPSSILRENKQLVEEANACAYCASTDNLQWEHIIPKCRGGADTIDNLVMACRACNLEKGDRDPYEWYGDRKMWMQMPRIVMGKFLKLAWERHERAGTLDQADVNADGKFDTADLGAIFTRKGAAP
jgi:hypothetical protein